MKVPFNPILHVQIPASSVSSLQYFVPNTEDFEIEEIRFIADAAFSVTDISDSGGIRYSNATSSNPIPSTLLQNAANDFLSFGKFTVPLLVRGSMYIQFNLLDTSGTTNDVWFLLIGTRYTDNDRKR